MKRTHTSPLSSLAVASLAVSSIACAGPQVYHDAVGAAGPVLWYQMGEPSGDVVNHGSLGAAQNMAVNGTPVRAVSTYAGDNAMRFDDAGDFLQSLGTSTLTGNPTFTCEAIVRLDAVGAAGTYGPFLHWGGSTTGTAVYFSVSHNDNTSIYTGFYNAGVRMTSLDGDRWHHVVWVREGGNDSSAGTTVYVNGRVQTMVQDPILNPGFIAAGSINITSTAFTVNRATNLVGTRRFTGEIDELALYNRALSPAEVATLAQASGLVCYADCDGIPTLNVFDYICFGDAYANSNPYADCDNNGSLNIFDYICFGNAYATGCP